MKPPPFAAALLAGGRSTRMGRDKALLRLSDGRLLWERQLDVIRALDPAELYVSGSSRAGFAPAGVTFIPDAKCGQGPLAGIAAILAATKFSFALVLAVDLPEMSAEFLRRLLATLESSAIRGSIPENADGSFEPLAAIYPRVALSIAQKRLHAGELSLQPFVRDLIAQKLASPYPIPLGDTALFTNWNIPSDVPRG